MLVCNANDCSLSQLDVCYEFVDVMFSRRLFMSISWAGGSKTNVKKTPFRNYRRTIEHFTSLVRKIHPDFSETTCQEFFKNKVISNSTKRAEKPPTRASRTKARKKKNFTQFIDDTGNSENYEHEYDDDEDDVQDNVNNIIQNNFKQEDGDFEVSVRIIMKIFRSFYINSF